MKKVLVIALFLLFAGLNQGFSVDNAEKNATFWPDNMGYITVRGVQYSLYSYYYITGSTTIVGVSWTGGSINNPVGYFHFVNGAMWANVHFYGADGDVIYDGYYVND